jgi:hypothetical protein
MAWQEGVGWVIGGKSPARGGGKPIEIKAGTTTVPPIELKPSED